MDNMWNDPGFEQAAATWAQQNGREPQTDADFAEISQMMEAQTNAYPQDVQAANSNPDNDAAAMRSGGKLRITRGEDSYPDTRSFDYSGQIDAEPRVDEQLSGQNGTMADLIGMMSRQMPPTQAQPAANFDQRMGPGSVGPSPTQISRLVDPRMMTQPQQMQPPQGGGGIEQLIQAILGGRQ